MTNQKGMKRDLNQEELITQIGYIIVYFNILEMTVQDLVGSLINEHQAVGQIITAQLSFRATRDLVMSLYFERHGKDSDFSTLDGLLKECAAIEGKRNLFVHSTWLFDEDPTEILRHKITSNGLLKFQFDPTSVDDLCRVSESIKNLDTRIQAFQIMLIKNGKMKNNPILKVW